MDSDPAGQKSTDPTGSRSSCLVRSVEKVLDPAGQKSSDLTGSEFSPMIITEITATMIFD